ncbi:HAMP domain-containing histidine kinase [Olsenella sp. DSM 107455]|uniref:Signal transduction histidine-protein kinase/phosphatase MprB n=1 Tax=Thermophilibacter gallinarum TaxID=2779357 RepID=A0ABR9QQG9_9ACTN|nr:HAMP domain-containing sensor histidine kinase [Thermophilibacter gallinarum]MBE5023317.1 HAMP domain-containing histidine kinase [Thermophilibacter gallinarum]
MSARFVTGERARHEDSPSPASSSASWNTIKPRPKRGRPFATRLTFAFALTAIMTAAVLAIVLAVVWEGQFMAYTRQNMQAVADSTAGVISDAYARTGELDEEVASVAGSASAISSEIVVQVVTVDGDVLYDDTWAASTTHAIDGRVAPQTPATAPASEGAMVSADITSPSGDVVGYVRLWALGSEALLTKADTAFRANSYGAIATAAAIAAILACVIGYFVSRSVAHPIQRITSTAKQIRNGDLTARSGVTGTDEVGQLGETFDDMAGTIERDLKLEHRLTGDVAHELRTPLMAMQATVEAMQDGVLPADDEHLEVVAGEVRRLSRLIDAMLKLSRLENGTTELKVERTDLVYLVKSLVSSQHQLFHERGLHLRFVDETPHHELYADVDPDLLREAIVNLMSNALRYTNADGWVKVSLRQDRSDFLVGVQDTGIGIAKEDIPQTFARFWRSDVSRERVSGGLGVGLAITKEIVDRHNGTILVESELGRGTTFTLRIPLRGQRKQQDR